MVLHLVTKRSAKPPLSIVRTLTPEEAAALCRVKQGLPGEDPIYRATVASARAKKLWILCDCRDGRPEERPVIVPVRKEGGQLHLSNIGRAEIPHAEDCLFAPGARRRKPVIVYGDVLRPVAGRVHAGEDDPGKGRRLMGPGTDSKSATLAGHLHRLMRAASLHRLSVAEGFTDPQEWLAAIRRAAGTFRTPEDIAVSELLFTDPKSWASGRVAKVLDGPKKGTPSAWLCWLARDGGEVNRAHPARVQAHTEPGAACPHRTVRRSRAHAPPVAPPGPPARSRATRNGRPPSCASSPVSGLPSRSRAADRDCAAMPGPPCRSLQSNDVWPSSHESAPASSCRHARPSSRSSRRSFSACSKMRSMRIMLCSTCGGTPVPVSSVAVCQKR